MNRFLVLTAIVISATLGSLAHAQTNAPAASAELMREVAFAQRLGESVPLDLKFRDSTGRIVRLGDYFGEKPVILTLVYYECPMLCTLELNGLVRSLKTLRLSAGEDFHILTVSFDPGETSELAAQKRANYLQQYGRDGAEEGWHFLTGEQAAIDAFCQAVGFHAAYDPARDQYAHAAGLVLLTREGTISRYLFGIDYAPRDLRLGLVETSAGKVGSVTDHLLLLCYGYDPATGKYGLVIINVIRLGGLATLLALGGFVALSFYRDYRASRDQNSPQNNQIPSD